MAKLRITAGDINSFIGLVVDNLSVLAFLAGALIGIFHFPAEVIFGKMFPGTALGALSAISSTRGWRCVRGAATPARCRSASTRRRR